MDSDKEEYYRGVTDYIVERATNEGSVLLYFKQNYGDKLEIHEFIYNIVSLSEDFFEYSQNNNDVFTNEDEYEYIAEKSGVSSDFIALIIWFKECYMMSTDCITYVGECLECGHKELFLRETEGVLYESHIECAGCGKEYSFDEYEDLDCADDE